MLLKESDDEGHFDEIVGSDSPLAEAKERIFITESQQDVPIVVEHKERKLYSPPFPVHDPDVLRWITLGWGILVMLISGTLYGFSAISNDIKHKLDFDQAQVNSAISIGDVGIYVGLTVGYLFDLYGPFYTCLIATVLYLIGYLGCWGIVGGSLPGSVYLLSFFLFMVGQGSHASFTAAIICNIHNWPLKHRGKVSGALVGLFAISSGMFGVIYRTTFERHNDVVGYLLFLAIMLSVISFIGAFTIRKIGPKEDPAETRSTTYEPLMKEDEDTESAKESDNKIRGPNYLDGKRDISGLDLLRTSEFWMMFSIYFFGAGTGLMFLNNIGSISLAFDRPSNIPSLKNITILPNAQQKATPLPNNGFWSTLPNITSVSLAGLKLTGPIPSILFTKGLTKLDLSKNQLTGPIPSPNLIKMVVDDSRFLATPCTEASITNMFVQGNNMIIQGNNFGIGSQATIKSTPPISCQISKLNTEMKCTTKIDLTTANLEVVLEFTETNVTLRYFPGPWVYTAIYSLEKDSVTLTGNNLEKATSVTIGGSPCVPTQASQKVIQCTPSLLVNGVYDVNITVTAVSHIFPKSLLYRRESACGDKTPACNGNGACVDERCECAKGWNGPHCEYLVSPSNSTHDPDKPSTNITIDSVPASLVNIELLEIREILHNGSIGRTDVLDKWVVINNSYGNHTYQHNFSNTSSIRIQVIRFAKDTDVAFLDQTLHMKADTVKYSIYIDRYPFSSTLSTLQLVTRSSVSSSGEQCGEAGVTTQVDSNDNVLWTKAKTSDGLVLYTNYIERADIDGRLSYISNKLGPKQAPTNASADGQVDVIVYTNIPYFQSRAYLDPDYSALVEPSGNKCSEEKNKWLIPVIVVSVVVAASVFGVAGFFAYKNITRYWRLR
eukprot:gene6595-7659_t